MSLDGVRQDVRSGLRRAPGFAAAALITLALGIGATSAIFTVVKAVLLVPLPHAQPATRVLLWSRWISFDKTWLSSRELLDYRRLATTLTAVAGWTTAIGGLTNVAGRRVNHEGACTTVTSRRPRVRTGKRIRE